MIIENMETNLVGAARQSRYESIKQLLKFGLLRDAFGRKLVEADPLDIERRLKARAGEVKASAQA